jgi:glycosyltransferase involved in cell wall biosynthesis
MISDLQSPHSATLASAVPQPLHIALVNPINEYYSPVSGGAVATILMQSAHGLLERGHRVSVLTPVNGEETYNRGDLVPLTVPRRQDLTFLQRALSRLKCRANQWVWPYYDHYLDSLVTELKKLDRSPDVLISFNDLVLSHYVRAHFPKCRYYVNLQNEIRMTRRDMAKLLGSVDTILACSRHIREWTAAEYRLPAGKLKVLHSGVDLQSFFPKADYLKSRDSLRVLFVGRIDRNKGPDIAADAVAAIRQEGRKVEFTVAGARWFYRTRDEEVDPYFELLMEKLSAVGARYLGHVTRKEIGGVFRNHDVVCVLSRSTEPFGLVVLEAMASGCAVVASDRGGLPDACGPAGVLVDPDDLSAVTRILRRFCIEPAALTEAKRRCYAHALQCSWAARVDELNELLPRRRLR